MTDCELIVGVSGGIAAYKTAEIVSTLVQTGAHVTVVMTPRASAFVSSTTFAALSGRPVAKELFDPSFPLGAHIELARRAKLLCVAPASADFLAKAAHGLADDLLSTLYLCFQGPVLMAPAMNHEMWAKASVRRNIEQLVDDGVTMLGPSEGWLSCRERGVGRMADPVEICQEIERAVS